MKNNSLLNGSVPCRTEWRESLAPPGEEQENLHEFPQWPVRPVLPSVWTTGTWNQISGQLGLCNDHQKIWRTGKLENLGIWDKLHSQAPATPQMIKETSTFRTMLQPGLAFLTKFLFPSCSFTNFPTSSYFNYPGRTPFLQLLLCTGILHVLWAPPRGRWKTRRQRWSHA